MLGPYWSSDVVIGDGSLTIGNVAGAHIASYGLTLPTSSDVTGFWLGHGPSNTHDYFRIGDMSVFGASLYWDGFNETLEIKNVDMDLDQGSLTVRRGTIRATGNPYDPLVIDSIHNVDVYIGANIGVTELREDSAAEELPGDSEWNDIILGSWGPQPMRDTGGYLTENQGLLIKHPTSDAINDYTSITPDGIFRRGFDFPILIHDEMHVGGPVPYPFYYGESEDNEEAHNHGIVGYFPSGTFAEGYGFGNNSPSSHTLYDKVWSMCIVNEDENHEAGAWNYRTMVPSNRKLIWQFQILGYVEATSNETLKFIWGQRNLDTEYSDGSHGEYSLWREKTFLHNAHKADGGMSAWQDTYHDDFIYGQRHHYGYKSGGCHNGHDSGPANWCYAGIDHLGAWIKYLNQGGAGSSETRVSISGTIYPYTDLSNLHICSAWKQFSHSGGVGTISGTNIGRLRIWETEATSSETSKGAGDFQEP